MNKRSIRDVQQVLDRHATTRSLDELARAGRRQVRAISEEKLLGLIGALVDDAIAAEAGNLRKQDRERIVARARDALGRVTKAQNESAAKIARQAETIEALTARCDALVAESSATSAQADEARRQAAEAEARVGEAGQLARDGARRAEQAAQQVERERARAAEIERSAARAVDQAETRRRTERTAAEKRLEAAAAGLDEARSALAARDADLAQQRSALAAATADLAARDAALEELRGQLEESRRQGHEATDGLSKRFALAEREANERAERTAAALTSLREELVRHQAEREQETAAARDALAALGADLAGPVRDGLARIERDVRTAAERPAGPDAATVDAIVTRLAGAERAAADDMQRRFDQTLARALGEVERALQRATARPVDEPVEATDALLGKIFDGEPDPQTNYDQVGGSVRRSPQRISRSLQQLKALRRSSPDADA